VSPPASARVHRSEGAAHRAQVHRLHELGALPALQPDRAGGCHLFPQLQGGEGGKEYSCMCECVSVSV
jgi:hypothetical protein